MTDIVHDRFGLTDKTAVITGAASGQGLASAKLFAAAGAFVVLIDRSTEAGILAVAEIAGQGGKAVFIGADLGDPNLIRSACDQILDEHGGIDILFNNAGIAFNPTFKLGSILDIELHDWNGFLDVNLTGAMLMTKYLAPSMRERGGGSILFNASIAGVVGQVGIDPYTATKGAIVALTRSLAGLLGPDGIRVNSIAPGAILTAMLEPALANGGLENRIRDTPLGRLGSADEVASVALFLASEASSFISGTTLVVDGGRSAVR